MHGGLEIFGAAALYVIGVLLLGYLGAAIAGYVDDRLHPGSGLAAVFPMIVVAFIIWGVGAVVGLILLGMALS